MATKSQQPKGREGILSLLNATIEAINLAKEASSITPAQAAFSAAGAPLTMVKESMINALDYVGLGLFCVNICKALDRRMDGKRLDGLSRIEKEVIRQSGRNVASRLWHAKNDKEVIAGWESELNRILGIFDTELINYDNQIDAAEEAASRAINPLPEKDQGCGICQCRHILGVMSFQGRNGEGHPSF